MKRLIKIWVLVFLATPMLGTQCGKDVMGVAPKESFSEKLDLYPEKKEYNIGDTIWWKFKTTDKTLFDTISQQRLPTNSISFSFNVVLVPIYDYQVLLTSGYCEFILPAGVVPNIRNSSYGSAAAIEVGCDNRPDYDIGMGLVLKYKGSYALDMSTASGLVPCAGQVQPYPGSYIRFPFNVNSTNKDVYLSIPSAARKGIADAVTERNLDAKFVYAFRVQ